jgi:N-carbamoylputrescine amidase
MTTPSDSSSFRQATIALIQMACSDSTEENFTRALSRIEEAAQNGAQVICLQELFSYLYPCQAEDHSQFDLAESIPGPITERLGQAAQEHEVVIIAPLFERRAAGVYHNTAVVIDADGSLLGSYRKMHIPDDPQYYEKFYFTPGDLGFRTFSTRYGKLGVCICWDQWFPEAARLTALSGAEILFFPTAIGWLPDEKKAFGNTQWTAWETMMRSHAIANGVYVAAPNRVGIEGELEFWGASFVADPNGNVMTRASHDQEEIVMATCQLDHIDTIRTHWPFLRDRRIDAYDGLQQRFLDDSET